MIILNYSDDDLPLKKTLKICNVIIDVRSVSHEVNEYYPQAFLDTVCINYKC